MLEIQGLRVGFRGPTGFVQVLHGVDLAVPTGKVAGLVGESGCGKSLTALSVVGLLPRDAHVASGRVLLEGRDLRGLLERELARVRGATIAMVFQQPRASLNPVFPVATVLTHLLRIHRGLGERAARVEGQTLLERVGLADPASVMASYPHQLSGGMCQRVMLAMALACGSRLLIADEPTTALDVTVQQQIIELLRALQRDLGLTVLLITHDLGLVAELCDEVSVMYAGRIVETASVNEFFAGSVHPYSRGLTAARIRVGSHELPAGIAGRVPNPRQLPSGCPFHPRCPQATELCRDADAAAEVVRAGHEVRCHHWRTVS